MTTNATKQTSKRLPQAFRQGRPVAWFFIGLVTVVPAGAALTMLAVGVLHSYWPQIPAFGFWETYLLMVAVNAVGGGIKTGLRLNAKAST